MSDVDDTKFELYQKAFDYVLLDLTGCFNIAYKMTPHVFDQVTLAAAQAVGKVYLFSEFENLFVNRHSFPLSFDVYFRYQILFFSILAPFFQFRSWKSFLFAIIILNS